jgi:metallo-beta-lactamase class B
MRRWFATRRRPGRRRRNSLGFKMTDVKVLLASHDHSDHVAGLALLRKVTGAKVYVMRGDERVVASGGKGQYLSTASRWDPCQVDRVLEDRDEVKLEGATLVARLTPGHTHGCTTWTWRVEDGGKQYDVVVIGSPNVNPGYQLVNNKEYPEIAADFARTFSVLKGLPCDVFLGAHAHYYGLVERYTLLKRGQANPFVNPKGYKEYVAQKERAFRKTLAAQQGKAENLLGQGDSRCRLDDEAAGVPEGMVVRSPDRSRIAKLRREDYERTLRRRPGKK